ncbi:MAG: SOS response-associated peptidase [Pyrinomonadaceae bacterium]
MCGRYKMTATERELFDKFPYLEQDEYFDIHGYKKSPEIFPGTDILAVNKDYHAEEVWWTIEDNDARGVWCRAINAKAETIMKVGMFKNAFATDRILIPANGLFEWQTLSDKSKQKYEIWFDERVFAFGGIARNCLIKGETKRCGAIMTTSPNKVFARLHNNKQRQPVVIRACDHEKWLDPTTPYTELRRLMQPVSAAQTHFGTVEESEEHTSNILTVSLQPSLF